MRSRSLRSATASHAPKSAQHAHAAAAHAALEPRILAASHHAGAARKFPSLGLFRPALL
jgi:hypothetical protein